MNPSTWYPAVVYAYSVQYAPGASSGGTRVESRPVVLCRAGRGTAAINGQVFELTEGSVLIMPWGSSCNFFADQDDPFFIGGMQLIPEHRADISPILTVPLDPHDELAGSAWRRDDPSLPGSQDTLAVNAEDYPGLVDIVRYAIQLFAHTAPSTDLVRSLGTLAIHELRAVASPQRRPRLSDLPFDLSQLIAYVDAYPGFSLTTRDLANVAGCSRATLTRRFRTYLGVSPMTWVTNRRLRRATDLLRTTSLSISQIAHMCGFADPYYFSRVFRRHHGEPPTSWRQKHHIL